MSRKAIVNSDVKIEACKQYRDGKGSIQSIAKSIGEPKHSESRVQWKVSLELYSQKCLIETMKDYISFYYERRFQKRQKCLTPIEYRNQALNHT